MVKAVFVLAPGVHLLDVSGPAQVLSSVGDVTGEPWELVYVGAEPQVPSHQGVVLAASTEWPALGPDDLVVVPGWRTGGHPGVPQPVARPLLARLAAHHDAGGEVMSVCSGAFAVGAAGLLDGRRATTHHELQDRLSRAYPRAQVVRDVLYVADDRVRTSAGIASGIDLALQVVAERLGPAVAAQVARTMVVFAHRNGLAPQQSVMLRHRDHLQDLVHRAQDVVDSRFTETLPLPDLARRLGVSERTLTRAFVRTLGMTPLRYQQALRREHAELLIASGATAEQAARVVGFQDARMLRRLRSAG